MHNPYIVEETASGWRVSRINPDNGALDAFDAVIHRNREVAAAYANAAAALEAYLAALDRREDSAELFEAWRRLDDAYEMAAIMFGDAPRGGADAAATAWSPASQTRH